MKAYPVSRSRWLYAVAMMLVVGAGLIWRSQIFPLPAFYFKYGGDALWALLIFLGFGFVFNRASTLRVGLIAFCFSCVVELTQLYHAPWIESVRDTRVGILVLGATFNWPDLIAYGVGIFLGCLSEIILLRRTLESDTN